MITLNLKNIRTMRGISTVELSKLSGVSTGYISKLENGLAMPTVITICKLASALKVCPGVLFSCSSNDRIVEECLKGGKGVPRIRERGWRIEEKAGNLI